MNNDIGKFTFRLIKERNSFSKGFTEMLNFESITKRYNIDEFENDADSKAIYADWAAVGTDLTSAIQKYEQKK